MNKTNYLWDRDAVLAWLNALGKKANDVHLRVVAVENESLSDKGTGKFRFPDLKTKGNLWCENRLLVGAVVNDGGQSNVTISSVRALYAEHDDLAKKLPEFANFNKEQADDATYAAYAKANKQLSQQLINDLVTQGKLPKPTMCVDTGGKSLHWFWRLEEGSCTVELWRNLQLRLIRLLDSDTTLKDPSRILRIPGFPHTRTGLPCRILFTESEMDDNFDLQYAEYTGAQFDEMLPVEGAAQQKKEHPLALPEKPTTAERTQKHRWFPLLEISQQNKCVDVMLQKIIEKHGRSEEGMYPGHEVVMKTLPGIFRHFHTKTWEEHYEYLTKFFSWNSHKYPGKNGFKQWYIGLSVNGFMANPLKIGATIRFARECGFDPTPWLEQAGVSEQSTAVIVADQLFLWGSQADTHIITLPDGKTYQRLEGDFHYTEIPPKVLRADISNWLMANIPKHCRAIKEILSVIQDLTFKDAQVSPDGYLNFTNGVLKIQPGNHVLLPHTHPEVESMVFLDPPACAYDPNADRTHAKAIMAGLEHDEAREIWLRVAAQALDTRQIPGTPVALINIGAGGNGKDVCVDVLRHIFGTSETTGIDLADLAKAGDAKQGNGTLAMLPLMHSRLNCPAETATNMKLNHVASLKTVITMERIKARNHFDNYIEFHPRAIHMFSVNEELLLDQTDAMGRRLRAVKWPYVFKFGEDFDPKNPSHRQAVRWYRPTGRDQAGIQRVKDEICPGFVLELLDAFDRFTGAVPSEHGPGIPRKYSDAVLNEMRESTDHVRKFIEDQEFVPTVEAFTTASVSLNALWDLYKIWCLEEGRAELMDGIPGDSDSIRMVGTANSRNRTMGTAFELRDRATSACGWVFDKPGSSKNKWGLKNSNYIKHVALPKHLFDKYNNLKENN